MSIYSCATQTSLNKLIVKQKEAVRIICNAGYRDHTAPLFRVSEVSRKNKKGGCYHPR